jgi:8-oxo-dGTP pyrophosphatase MutT (NUDIX family)
MKDIINGVLDVLVKEGKREKLRRRVEVFIIDKNDKILAGKSKDGVPIFPGGGIDKGETINQAANRESMEEVGLSIKNIKGVGVSPKNILWGDKLKRWMNDSRDRNFDGSRTYYRIANVDKKDSSILGKDGDEMKAKFVGIDKLRKTLKKVLIGKGKSSKFKPFIESDKKVLDKIKL